MKNATLRETIWPYATESYKDINVKTHLEFKGRFYNAHVPDNDRPTMGQKKVPYIKEWQKWVLVQQLHFAPAGSHHLSKPRWKPM